MNKNIYIFFLRMFYLATWKTAIILLLMLCWSIWYVLQIKSDTNFNIIDFVHLVICFSFGWHLGGLFKK